MKLLVSVPGDFVIDVKHLEIISSLVLVDREDYGKDAKYLPTDRTPSIECIQDAQVITGKEETEAELRKRLKATEQEKSDQWLKLYQAQEEAKKLKEQLATLKALCPHPEEKAEVKDGQNS